MMRLWLFVLVLLSGIPAATMGQNLVPNPGFEINTGCPAQINQVGLATGWGSWAVTPDYFHACSNSSSPNYGVPSNVRGYQQPHSGQAYIGLYTFADQFPNMREFVGSQLSQPLTVGRQYFVSIWVCAVEQFLSTHASNKIGFRFSTVPFSQANPDTALNNGHVFSTAIISDMANWTLFSGTFIADSAYQFIGIGNYFDDANTLVDSSNSHPTSNYAYYLIDDICVSASSKECNAVTSIDDNAPIGPMDIYPNPATGQLSFTGLRASVGAEVLVYNGVGQRVFQKMLEPGNAGMDLSFLPKGFYVLTVRQQDDVAVLRLLLSGD